MAVRLAYWDPKFAGRRYVKPGAMVHFQGEGYVVIGFEPLGLIYIGRFLGAGGVPIETRGVLATDLGLHWSPR